MLSTDSEDKYSYQSQRWLRRIRNELVFEAAFVALCFLFAITLKLKIVIAVVLTCLKFAIPDFITGYLVLKHDPSRIHGLGVAFLFLASGMSRASQFAFLALFATACLVAPLIAGPIAGNLIAIGLGTGFVCAFLFVATVFPLTLVAVYIARSKQIKLSFARQLTKLRKTKGTSGDNGMEVELNIDHSIKMVSVASAFGLSVCLISILFLLPQQGIILDVAILLLPAAFILPLCWIPFMAISISPNEAAL